MLTHKKNIFIFLGSFSFVTWISFASPGGEKFLSSIPLLPDDTTKRDKNKIKRPEYTEEDRHGDPFSNRSSKSPLLGPSPSRTDVIIDDTLDTYTIEENIGGTEYRTPSTMTFDEYMKYRNQESMKSYWKNKNSSDTSVNSKDDKSIAIKLKAFNSGRSGPFGSDYVEIRPSGTVGLDFGWRWQRVQNPNIPVKLQRQGQFDFDQTINMNVVGKIGEKLKLSTNWDTKAAFEFQNSLKLEFTGFEEDIIQKIEAGNVSLPLNSTLISGAQNLFGVKTKLQFGRLTTTTVFSTQRGKVEEIKIQGGSQSREFEIKADNYDDYRHFFLNQFFRDNYERSLKTLPTVTSGINIKPDQVQVWVTNRVSNTKDLKNFVAYLDLAEPDTADMYRGVKYYKTIVPQATPTDSARYPAGNDANSLYERISTFRNAVDVSNELLVSEGLIRGTDFEVINGARKLSTNEYTVHPELGYISLNTPIRPDEVLAVSYQYSYNGQTYTVGDSPEKIQASSDKEVMVLKLLKPASIKTRLPSWDLMMKNIYQLGGTQISRENFQLRVIYKNDLNGADLPNLQEGSAATVPLLRLTGLDRLNPNNDPYGDGNFDYVEGITIDSKNGRIIFPVAEPFGSNIQRYFNPVTETELINKYTFFELYDSTKSDAMQVAAKNKFYLKGRYQAGSSSEIVLPGINIAPGSVTVLAGSSPLQEGVDYDIDYNLGRLRIKNQGVLASNQEISIRFEKQDFINFRRKSFIGNRTDYRINKDFYIGSTLLHQTESPNISRVNIGDEPSKNTIVGLDANFKAESRFLTKVVDKLPIIQTKAISSVTFAGEGAGLFPGYPKLLDKSIEENGTSYLDDFEGAETPYDLTRIPTKWRLGSTPMRFPDAISSNLSYTDHRAKLAWYSLDNIFHQNNTNIGDDDDFVNNLDWQNYRKNYFVKLVTPPELYAKKFEQQINVPEPLLDLAYFPEERGPYNYNTAFGTYPARENWAAMTREFRNDIDFDNANIQYIEFWMMDPYMNSVNTDYGKMPLTLDESGWISATATGELYFNLGSVSEDVMKDSRHAYENGLPVTSVDQSQVELNEWGKVTTKPFLTNAFDNSEENRSLQDVGLDGLNNADEKNHPDYPAPLKALDDPSSDDFIYYLGPQFQGKNIGIIQRYKNYNGLENNSPVNTGTTYTPSNSTLPDNEDLNSDNTLNEVEEYYEYKIKIDPNEFQVGKNHIVDVREVEGAKFLIEGSDKVKWYLFRVPIREPDSTVGQISGFKTIRFIRTYLTGFDGPIILRMAQLQMVANQWRVYQGNDINPPGIVGDNEPAGAELIVSTVNIEENGAGSEFQYQMPPGIERDQDVVSQTYRQLNEQSLQLCIDRLEDGVAKAAFKNVSYNLINYDRVKMFIHAHTTTPTVTQNGEVSAFLRLGTDNTQNYYEIEVPLEFSADSETNPNYIWPAGNTIDVAIKDLIDTKGERNRNGGSVTQGYSRTIEGKLITVVGNPDISAVLSVTLGLRNPQDPGKEVHSVCIWANELRATGFNMNPAYATTARMNLKLADFATVNLSGKYTTVGWGSLDQKVSQRERFNTGEWGVSSNIALDKFIPEKVGLKLPMFVSYDQRIISPKYDPLDPDMLLKESLKNISDPEKREQYKEYSVDKTTRHSINFTNIQKVKTKKDAKSHLWDIENLSLTTAYSETRRTNVNIKEYNQKYYKGEIGYNYNFNSKPIQPFSKMEGMKSPYLKFIKDLNFTPLPSTITFRSALERRLTKTQYYEGRPTDGFVQQAFFEKQFTFVRDYGLSWNITKSINFDYKAGAYSIIDEPNRDPDVDKKGYNDSLLSNVLRMGRLKDFDQNVSLTYKLPLDKFPLTEWINADAKYNSGFKWTSGALGIRDSLGNLIQNNQGAGIRGKVNLDKLYNKVKFLKDINNPPPPLRPNQKDTSKTLPKKELKALKSTLRALMSIRAINFSYDVTRSMALPGYMPIPKYMGMTPGANSFDMFPFAFGSQDPGIRKTAADNGWMSRSRFINTPFTQQKLTSFIASTQMEPVKDLRITLDLMKKKSTNYQELFRMDTLGTGYASESPSRNGSLSMSVITIKTAFGGKVRGSGDPNSSKAFQDFENYRDVLRNRLENSGAYDTNAQNVLIPAFLAAYTGSDPNKISTRSPYPKIPLPNWKIDFTGLTKIKSIKKIFPTFTISHNYQSTYAINNYTSSLLYQDDFINPHFDIHNSPYPVIVNDTGLLVPVYFIENVTITEAFNPLLGVTFRTTKKVGGNISYRKARALTLNLTNGQVQEVLSQDVTFGVSMIRTGVKIPFTKLPPLKNELNAKLDITIGDRKTIQRKFEQAATITAGNLNIQIRPSATYAVNSRLNVIVYMDRTVNAPKISSSYKSSTTRFGVKITFTLS